MIRRSKKLQIMSMILAILIIFTSCNFEEAFAATSNNNKQEAAVKGYTKKHKSNVHTDIIVKYKDATERNDTIKDVKANAKINKFEQRRYFKKAKIGIYEINKSDDMDAVIEELNSDPNVVYAQPNYPLSTAATPTDDKLDKQWALYNYAQEVNGYSGRSGVDINAFNAWNLTMGDSDVVVGVLDTGINISNAQLAGNIYTNAGEIAGNGVDDDGNGYIDDIHGWDFSNDDASLYDSETADTHGTYVAGIIAASANDSGIVGVAPNIKVLPLKFISGSTGYTSDAIEAIEYAKNLGIKIMNCSFGGTDNNQALKDAMAGSGILFICAAGNRGGDTSEKPVYPAAFALDNVLSVTSIDSKGAVPDFASYGADVDVAAPGVSIISIKQGGGYDYYSGTSVSAALVSGIAGLVKSYLPGEGILAIKNRIINSARKCTSLNGLTASGGRVDAYGALTGIVQALDSYTGESEVDDTLPVDGEGEADTWYTMSELANNAERLHYGEGGINPATGNYSVTCTDLSVPAPGFTVNISRSYNSRNQRQTLLGRGWTFGFEGKVTNKTDSIEVSLPNGSSHEFKLVNGSYVGVNTRAKFVKNVNGADVLTTTDQYQYGFDPTSNKMTYMQDKNGNRIILTYANGKLTKITDTVGRDYGLTYNDSNLLASVTDPAGRVVRYTYNADNLLVKVTDPELSNLKYEYDSSQYLTKQIDQKEYTFQELTYSHDMGAAENKVIASKDAAGQTWSYSYDLSASSTTITDAGSKKWTYWYNYYYDTVKMQDPEGKFTVTEYDYPTEPNNYYSDVKARVDRNGNRTEYVVDQATGNVTKVTNPDLSFKTFTYDQWNNVVKEVNEKGSITYYIYDSTGARLLKKAQPLNGTDNYAEGNTTNFAVTSYTYYSKSEANSSFGCNVEGLQKTVTDPEGNTTTYTYNSYGDIASTKDAAGNITTDTYNAVGQKESETTPTGFTTQWKYDQNGKVIREIHPDGGVKRYVYDAAGNTVLEVNPNQYSAALDNTSTDVYSGTVGTSYEWKPNGYLNSVTDAEGNRTEYKWDSYGNKESETKPNQAVYSYKYDSLNRLTKTFFKESASASEVLLSEISYGILNNGNSQISKTEYADSTHKYTTVTVKDYADREVEVQNPDGSRIITTYNPDGTIGQKTAANGAITYYSYDALGNMTDVRKPMSVVDGNAKYSWTGYSYDKAGKLLTEKTGKALTALNGTAENVYEKQYQYVNGLLKQETDSDGRKTEYNYNGDNRIAELTQTVSQTETQKTINTYNYRGQALTVTKQVRAGDISTYDYTNDSIIDYSSSYLYDKNGNMTSYTDPAGILTQYTYDKLDRLLSTTRCLKNGDTVVSSTTVSQTYTWDGQIASKTDARHNTTNYTYDAQGNQTMITDALTKVTLKAYDLLGRNTAIVSPNNYKPEKSLSEMERTEFVYDSMNRVVKQKELYFKLVPDGAGNLNREWADVTVKEYEYDSLGNITSEKDALGNTKTTVYNLAGLEEYETDAETRDRGLPFTVSYAYNGLGQKVKETYQDIVYTYEYDGAGNLLCTKADDVTKSSTVYDLLGRAVQLTDARGNVTTQKWNALGKLSKVVKPDFGTTTYQYDLLGNTINLKNNSAVTVYAYDYLGRTLSCTIKNLAGDVSTDTSYTYDQNGNILTQTDGKNQITGFTYDVLNRKETETNSKLQTTTYTYDANGNELTKEDYLGNTTTKVYDGINRLVETRDAYNKVIQQLSYNNANVQTSSFDALNHETQYLYDKNLRQTGTIDGEQHTSSMTYDTRGNVTSRTDGRGNTTSYQYDGEGHLTKVTDALGNSTRYTYDAAGNLLTQTDGNNNTTTYSYNNMNLVETKTDPEGNKETYQYDYNGRMINKVDRNLVTTVFSYDSLGRLTSQTPGGSYTYDANSNLLTTTDSTGTTTRTYDVLNRCTSKTVPGLGQSTYEYDLSAETAGEYKERTTDPKGNVTVKTYDKAGRLSKVTVGSNTTVYKYNDNGTRSKVTYPGNITENYTYNRNNQVTNLTNKKADETVISSYQYTYDEAGNQLTKAEAKGTTTYTYDNLNRLESVMEPDEKKTTYTYDGAGNRKTEQIEKGLVSSATIYAYDTRNRLTSTLSSDGTETRYLYDNNGNLIQKTAGEIQPVNTSELTAADLPGFELIIRHGGENGTGSDQLTSYTYDQENRLIQTKTGNTTSTYSYNIQGYRVSKKVNNNTTKYLYEGDKVVLETDENNVQKAFQVYGSNLLYRSTAADGVLSAQSYYYLYNAHGDVTALTDASGNTAVTYDYDAFGTIINQTGTANNSIKYAGYQQDEESGLYYLNARYYDSVTARFITEDTYTGQKNDPLSLNLYAYCNNNPIKYIDPSGHKKETSVVDYLKSQKEDSSFAARKELAADNGIKNYTGTATQNTKLLKILKAQDATKEETSKTTTSSKDSSNKNGGTSTTTSELKKDSNKTINQVNSNANGLNNSNSKNEGNINSATANTGSLVLTDEMKKSDVTITTIDGKQYYDYSEPISAAFYDAATEASKHKDNLIWFKSKVDHNAKWDIKRENPWIQTIGDTYPGNYDTEIVVNGEITTPEELGNIMYGYTGTAAEISPGILMAGSTYAAGIGNLIKSKTARENEKKDKDAILKGIRWYNTEHQK